MKDRSKDPRLDMIADKSEAQKQIRLSKLRVEVGQMGYSIVRSDWLQELITKVVGKEEK